MPNQHRSHPRGPYAYSKAKDYRLYDLLDVTINGIASGEILKWDGTGWVNNTLAEAGISAAVHTHVEADITDLQAYLLDITGEPLSDLSDVTITAIASGELLKWNGSAWINQTLAEAGISAVGHTHTESDITDLGPYLLLAGGTLTGATTIDVDGSIPLTITTNTTPLSITSSVANTNWIQMNEPSNLARVGHFGTGFGLLAQTAGVDIVFVPGSGGDVMWGSDVMSIVGHTHLEADITDLGTYFEAADTPLWTGVHTWDGVADLIITPGAVPKIESTSTLQYEAATGASHWFTINGTGAALIDAGGLNIGSSSVTDLYIHEPTAGEWTIEAQSTNELVLLSGSGVVRVDGSNVNVREGADTARVKLMRANNTLAAPTAVTSGNWMGDYQFYGYDGAGYDLVATIRARASEGFTASLHGTDLLFYATPDGHATQEIVAWYNATGETFEFDCINGVVIDNATATLEIQSAADAKLVLRDDGSAAWNRIDFYETTNRHGYLGFGTANNFLIVNEESAGVIKLETTGGGQIQLDDGGTNDGRVASIKTITATATAPTGDYPYGCLHLIY
jgi:hypothetical protein